MLTSDHGMRRLFFSFWWWWWWWWWLWWWWWWWWWWWHCWPVTMGCLKARSFSVSLSFCFCFLKFYIYTVALHSTRVPSTYPVWFEYVIRNTIRHMWIVDVSKRSDSTLSANALISMPLHCNTFAVCNASPVWSAMPLQCLRCTVIFRLLFFWPQCQHPDLGLVSATSKPSSWPVTILSDVSSLSYYLQFPNHPADHSFFICSIPHLILLVYYIQLPEHPSHHPDNPFPDRILPKIFPVPIFLPPTSEPSCWQFFYTHPSLLTSSDCPQQLNHPIMGISTF